MTAQAAPRPGAPIVRDSEDADLPAIAAIYRHHVVHGFGSFEEVPPDAAELARRRREILDKGLPYIIASDETGAVLGYAYASPYRARSAYRFTVEDTIYVAPTAARRGIGRLLVRTLIDRCARLGYRQMIAVIGDSGNSGSIGLHQSLGFARAALLPSIGFKRDRWVDCVMMQRALGGGSDTPPVEIAKP
jgi:phosphinothricin acetyltransferase